jgi:hypothetical protein
LDDRCLVQSSESERRHGWRGEETNKRNK